MVPGGGGSSGVAVRSAPQCLQGLHPGAEAPGQRNDVPLHVPHHLQHPRPDNAAGLRPGTRLPQQVPGSAGPEPGSVLPVQLCDALAGGASGHH
ncbi:hypothetical protein E3U43_005394 [Larimichthys crocea]|nr:hypothetical protein E3U43_005394 [Larimichthys crocea]